MATLYHYVLGWAAPYALPSLPKLLGMVGGISLLVGTAGLWRLNRRRHPLHGDAAQKPMDLGFIALLFLTSASGLALLAGPRHAAPWRCCCALHLGAVMALFVTLPYGKFAHGIFRSAALLQPCDRKAPAEPDRPGRRLSARQDNSGPLRRSTMNDARQVSRNSRR